MPADGRRPGEEPPDEPPDAQPPGDGPPEGRDRRVLVVDDQAPFRSAARAVVERTPGFAVAGEASGGEEGVEAAVALAPDLVLMDIRMPDLDGIAATDRIASRAPGVVVFLLSTYARDDLPEEVSTSGAAAYLHKEELSPAVLADLWRTHRPGGGG